MTSRIDLAASHMQVLENLVRYRRLGHLGRDPPESDNIVVLLLGRAR